MATNKDTGKIHDLSEKIASDEGLKVEEIEQDISKQIGHPPQDKAHDLPHRVAHQEGVRVTEVNKDLTEQMGVEKAPVKTTSSNVWIYVVVIAAFALAAWWIFSKYF